MKPWNQPESDPLADLNAAMELIKQLEKDKRLGKFGTRMGDIVLTKHEVRELAESPEFQKETGHTLESFEREAKDNGMVEFGYYRVMIA